MRPFNDDDYEIPLKLVNPTLDDEEQVDVILVYTHSDMVRSLKKARIKQFLRNLERTGLRVSNVQSLSDPNLVFVKISADDDIVYHYAPGFGIDLHCNNRYFVPEVPTNIPNVFNLNDDENIALRKIS